jgi:hypothetical protein
MRSRFSGRYQFDAHKWRCDGIATRLYKADKRVIKQRGTWWHLSQITDEIEPSERGRHVLGARRKSESKTRKLRCAKPSAPKPSRRRMKPILDWTKSKAEAYAPGAAPIQFAFFKLEFQRFPAVEGAPAVSRRSMRRRTNAQAYNL